MAVFKGLSQIIHEQINNEVTPIKFSPDTAEAITTGQHVNYVNASESQPVSSVFRWGYSVWGVDKIIDKWFPNE
jgi:hypothetical protein